MSIAINKVASNTQLYKDIRHPKGGLSVSLHHNLAIVMYRIVKLAAVLIPG